MIGGTTTVAALGISDCLLQRQRGWRTAQAKNYYIAQSKKSLLCVTKTIQSAYELNFTYSMHCLVGCLCSSSSQQCMRSGIFCWLRCERSGKWLVTNYWGLIIKGWCRFYWAHFCCCMPKIDLSAHLPKDPFYCRRKEIGETRNGTGNLPVLSQMTLSPL
jgi:hypothetical protein